MTKQKQKNKQKQMKWLISLLVVGIIGFFSLSVYLSFFAQKNNSNTIKEENIKTTQLNEEEKQKIQKDTLKNKAEEKELKSTYSEEEIKDITEQVLLLYRSNDVEAGQKKLKEQTKKKTFSEKDGFAYHLYEDGERLKKLNIDLETIDNFSESLQATYTHYVQLMTYPETAIQGLFYAPHVSRLAAIENADSILPAYRGNINILSVKEINGNNEHFPFYLTESTNSESTETTQEETNETFGENYEEEAPSYFYKITFSVEGFVLEAYMYQYEKDSTIRIHKIVEQEQGQTPYKDIKYWNSILTELSI